MHNFNTTTCTRACTICIIGVCMCSVCMDACAHVCACVCVCVCACDHFTALHTRLPLLLSWSAVNLLNTAGTFSSLPGLPSEGATKEMIATSYIQYYCCSNTHNTSDEIHIHLHRHTVTPILLILCSLLTGCR